MERYKTDMNGYYQISNLGRVKSLKRKVNWYGNRKRTIKEKILKISLDTHGYFKVELLKNNIKLSKKIHRLVAENFISNPNNYPCVNHKDENKQNNNVDNLEWCTYQYNNTYGTKLQRTKEKIGKKVLQYDITGNFVKEWNSCGDASRKLNINWSNLVGVCNNKRKTAGGYIWKYKEEKQNVKS